MLTNNDENYSNIIVAPVKPSTITLRFMNPNKLADIILQQEDKLSHKKGEKWFLENMIYEANKIYGKGNINFDYVDQEVELHTTLEFLLECEICGLIWPTNLQYLITYRKGCPWCRNKCQKLKRYNLDVVKFISNKIFGPNVFYYHMNNPKNITNPNSILEIWCGIEDHPIFKQLLGEHLSHSKRGNKSGCEICKANNKKTKRKWKGNLALVISEGDRIHGKDIYDYSNNSPTDIVNSSSELNITCKNITFNGTICNNSFKKSINHHILQAIGCKLCYGSFKYDYNSFKKAFYERYGDKFSLELVKEEDINGIESKPKVLCTVPNCGYIIDNTSIKSFLNSALKRQCSKCINRIFWTPERLKNVCDEREKISTWKYSYDDVDFKSVINAYSIMAIICKHCRDRGLSSYKFHISINEHINNEGGCSRCSGKMSWCYDRFVDELLPMFKTNFDYSLVTPEMIQDKLSEILIKCLKCMNYFSRTVSGHVLRGEGCTYCTKSKGEKIVYMLLKDQNIEFKDEFHCPGLKNYDYRYDFFLVYKNKEIIIEYDGLLHFKQIEFWNTEQEFLDARNRDIYKQKYALQKGYKIIRIDHSIKPENIEFHIKKGLECQEKEYFSTPSMYDWLIEGVKNYSLDIKLIK